MIVNAAAAGVNWFKKRFLPGFFGAYLPEERRISLGEVTCLAEPFDSA